MSAIDLTNEIEVMPDMEARVGARLSALSAFFTDQPPFGPEVEVRGELAGEISSDVEIQVAVFDAGGRIVGTENHFVDSDEFIGLHVFELNCTSRGVPARIRVTVTPS